MLHLQARNNVTPEIGIEQFGFAINGADTRNAICVMRMITEQVVEMQKDFQVFYKLHRSFWQSKT